MRALVAKHLRSDAAFEMANDKGGVIDRDLITIDRSGSLVNTPHSIRALYLKLKAAYKKARAFAGIAKEFVQRVRAGSQVRRAQPDDRIIAIEKPLDFILGNCPPTQSPTDPNTWIPHPVYLSAQRAAKAGRGDLVTKMARQFLPA